MFLSRAVSWKESPKGGMKMISKLLALSAITFIAAAPYAWAETPKMKMTTEIPPGIETPDKLESSIGTLTSVNGVPDAATTQKVYDQLDLNRATEAFLNCIPIASMYGLKHGILKHGPANTTAVLFEELIEFHFVHTN